MTGTLLGMTPSHLFNGSDWLINNRYKNVSPESLVFWLHGVIGERHTGYAHNRILPVGP